METILMIQKATAVGNCWLAAASWQCARSCITSPAECFSKTSNHPMTQSPYCPDLAPCDFWLFPKLKLPLKGKRFQTVNEIQKSTTEQLMATGRTVWGPKVPTLKGTEASSSYVQCFLHLVSSSMNVSIFHSTWLDTFGTDLVLMLWSILYACLSVKSSISNQKYYFVFYFHFPYRTLGENNKKVIYFLLLFCLI